MFKRIKVLLFGERRHGVGMVFYGDKAPNPVGGLFRRSQLRKNDLWIKFPENQAYKWNENTWSRVKG